MRTRLILVFTLLTLAAAHGASDGPDSGEPKRGLFLSKLARGLGNIVLSVGELPMTMTHVASETSAWNGMLAGGAAGLGATLERLGAGIFDTATFPFPPYYHHLVPYQVGRHPAAMEAIDSFAHDAL